MKSFLGIMSKRFQLIPARGRKPNTKDHILKIIVAFQLIPARGRKPICFGQIVERLGKFQLIPARGRKPKLRLRLARDLFISTYPRKGTETLQQVQEFRIGPYISTYPRKGTETGSLPVGLHISLDFNLSPQGDGNSLRLIFTLSRANFNLSPQGDGNIKKMIPDFTSLNYFNLSPQGGKKLRIKNGAEFFFCVP